VRVLRVVGKTRCLSVLVVEGRRWVTIFTLHVRLVLAAFKNGSINNETR
jgi:hypothetical protein